MGFLKDRRVVAFGGAGLALVAGLLVAWLILSHTHKPTEAPPASQGGLVVVTGRDDDAKLDPKRPLRCFVGGQFVGELPLAVCAQRNGVATGALDVGLDQAGALAASTGGNQLTPLPTQPAEPLPVIETQSNAISAAGQVPESQAATQACWRFAGAGWRELPTSMGMQACIQALFAGRCPGPDDVYYGRWGDQTLRLAGGRVDISPNNRDFSPVVDPWPACQPPD